MQSTVNGHLPLSKRKSKCKGEESTICVSVIIPIYNAEEFLDECLESVRNQTTASLLLDRDPDFDPNARKITKGEAGIALSPDSHSISNINYVSDNDFDEDQLTTKISIEVSMFDDGSSDNSPALISKWSELFLKTPSFSVVTSKNSTSLPKGVGYAKNRAVEQSTGEYLCFCDADDVMEPNRVVEQLRVARFNRGAIVGSKFTRRPLDSTRSFTHWANNITSAQLETQIYLAFGPTVVMPTWFCHRNVYKRISGGFDEKGKGIPEDLLFFYQHLNRGGSVLRVNQSLMIYRYHVNATTFSVPETTIWQIRISHFCEHVLTRPDWQEEKVTIWGAGKLGKRFFRSVLNESQGKEYVKCIRQFCDIDDRKIKQKVYEPYPNPHKLRIPIVRYEDAKPPFVVCIKTEFMWDPDGPFQKFSTKGNLVEGRDYFYFS